MITKYPISRDKRIESMPYIVIWHHCIAYGIPSASLAFSKSLLGPFFKPNKDVGRVLTYEEIGQILGGN